ncbi:rod shape-determining protein MreC [Campylobacter hepaticus]|uniref:rod shape-determining protein MreC n=1 Tax=Campylobacter hepaticus TaxID=1813019 RepID=UPI0029B93CA0|nr:rod shape-determining protein MreC [Campylobacter hepaticus]MDX2330977.1 rod shape-determining protein MreC [Campylobacter hepaticus]MDX2371698.1 rod shape-determining protein MreC [Campylobacter hepaticus]MDX2396842.1 rod shape-determining protein MreC [Campylobacter hepaticus]MDX5508856.1 rod shape-determining protein MreC [Campylobacter hepaticus]
MKNKIFYVLILAFLVFISFYYGGLVKQNVLRINDLVISNFYNIKDYLGESISQHFNQIEQIQKLKIRNKELEDIAVKVTSFANQLNRILEDQNSTKYLPQVSLTRVISYVQLNDYKKLWLDWNKIPITKNRGLIYQGYTAGIAINKNGRAMALLQGDDQCVFSVYIGKLKAPGLIQGEDGKLMVQFIPKWAKINIGDEILTSGLDNIFFSDIPVGIVSKINDEDMYQSVEVKPYIQISIPNYLYVVDSL